MSHITYEDLLEVNCELVKWEGRYFEAVAVLRSLIEAVDAGLISPRCVTAEVEVARLFLSGAEELRPE